MKLIPLIALAAGIFYNPAARGVPRTVRRAQQSSAPRALQRVRPGNTHPEIEALIRESARKYGLPEERVVYIAWRESKFQPTARSKSGRYVGLYQFDLQTWNNTPEGRAGRRREEAAANINAAHWHMKVYGFQAWAMPGSSRTLRSRGRKKLV